VAFSDTLWVSQISQNLRYRAVKKMPIVESVVTESKDGQWMLHKTIITDMRPVRYFEKVLRGTGRKS
jgi:hypothetical protein